MWSSLEQSPIDVQTVLSSVKRQLRLKTLDLSRYLLLKHACGNVGRIRHQHREGLCKLCGHTFYQVTLNELHALLEVQGISVASCQRNRLRRKICSVDARLWTLSSNRERYAARSYANLKHAHFPVSVWSCRINAR